MLPATKRGRLQPRVVPQLDERQCQGRYKPSALARSALAAHLEVRLKVCQVALLRREELQQAVVQAGLQAQNCCIKPGLSQLALAAEQTDFNRTQYG